MNQENLELITRIKNLKIVTQHSICHKISLVNIDDVMRYFERPLYCLVCELIKNINNTRWQQRQSHVQVWLSVRVVALKLERHIRTAKIRVTVVLNMVWHFSLLSGAHRLQISLSFSIPEENIFHIMERNGSIIVPNRESFFSLVVIII